MFVWFKKIYGALIIRDHAEIKKVNLNFLIKTRLLMTFAQVFKYTYLCKDVCKFYSLDYRENGTESDIF